jgi:hypothetical protein
MKNFSKDFRFHRKLLTDIVMARTLSYDFLRMLSWDFKNTTDDLRFEIKQSLQEAIK